MKTFRWGILSAVLVSVAAMTAALAWSTSQPVAESDARPVLAPSASIQAQGAAAFVGAGFGGISTDALESSAIPWKLAAAALVLEERGRNPDAAFDQATLQRVMERFGFLYPSRIANLPPGLSRADAQYPLGLNHGTIAPLGGTQLEVANISCSACHAGVSYATDGAARPDTAILGAPNSSLDLERYTQAIFTGFRRHGRDELLAAANNLFPDMSAREKISLRWLVMPMVEKRMEKLKGSNRALPFPNGSPGLTNGVAALKSRLGTPLAGGGAADDGAVSIPTLGDHVWRNSLLVDGAYSPPKASDRPMVRADVDRAHLKRLAAITTFFTVPSMGVPPEKAKGSIPDAEAIFVWLKDLQPQPFPGKIDRAAASRGGSLYTKQCSSCHGAYGEHKGRLRLTSYPNWLGEVGTDPLRARMFDKPLANAIRSSPYREYIEVRPGRGYAALPLTGVWASAPYLHNGSVPTLEALLDPSRRPTRFLVGGHSLDFASVGIRLAPDGSYPDGSRPFSTPAWYDTRKPGRQNVGHLFGARLSPAERRDLIEYLKRL